MMLATCVACSPEAMPRLTVFDAGSVCTTNGTDSRIAVAALSWPNSPMSCAKRYGRMLCSSANEPSASESIRTWLRPSQRMAKLSPQAPLRFRSPPVVGGVVPQLMRYSDTAGLPLLAKSGFDSRNAPNFQLPSGAPV